MNMRAGLTSIMSVRMAIRLPSMSPTVSQRHQCMIIVNIIPATKRAVRYACAGTGSSFMDNNRIFPTSLATPPANL